MENNIKNLKEEIKEIYKVKSDLGLIYPYESADIDFNNEIEIVFIFANQNPKYSKVVSELEEVKNSDVYKKLKMLATIKVAKGSFMGYGLYEENIEIM